MLQKRQHVAMIETMNKMRRRLFVLILFVYFSIANYKNIKTNKTQL